MAVIVKTLYGTDFAEWSAQTAELLRQRQLRRILMHLVQQRIQPERDGASWRTSIVSAQQEMPDAIDSSPRLRRRLTGRLEKTYEQAIRAARSETGLDAKDIPAECPFTLDQLLDGDPTLLHV
jgi:hypothetical protein